MATEKTFYKFHLQDKAGNIYLNKKLIVAFNQHGTNDYGSIKMVNGTTFNVAHNESQILAILEAVPENS